MTIKPLTLTAITLMLAGCQTTPRISLPPDAKPTRTCQGVAECTVSVRVKPACEVNIAREDEFLGVRGQNVLMRWELDADAQKDGYRFSIDPIRYGIVIENYDPTREFTDPRATPATAPTRVTVMNRNSFRQNYKYTINVVGKDGPCPPLDPFIFNN